MEGKHCVWCVYAHAALETNTLIKTKGTLYACITPIYQEAWPHPLPVSPGTLQSGAFE